LKEDYSKIEVTCSLVPQSFDELKSRELALVLKAKQARVTSHSPYSNYSVGAALLLGNGEIVSGSNQENAAYPSGLCAERTTMFAAGALYPGVNFEVLAVAIPDTAENLPSPCGACLQVMAEYQFKQESPLKILLIHPREDIVYVADKLQQMLPFAFNQSHLPKK